MSVDDLDDVLDIEQSSFSFPWSRSSFYGEIQKNNFAYYIVARPRGEHRVIGYGGLWVVCDEGHITTLAVHPFYRKTGAGSFMLDHLLKKAREKGARRVFLEVRDSNLAARHLYEKFCFKIIGRRKNYYLDEDALIMVHTFLRSKDTSSLRGGLYNVAKNIDSGPGNKL
jgi:ribosomal-protein-alanine N-acetyltransferase